MLSPSHLSSPGTSAFQASDTLKNRSFWGLITAQFGAGFNDQAIHAASMFYAIHHATLSEASAISLMPILFYAPWAIFCTLSGYLADRYSKRFTLVTWKVVEVGITLLALFGFILGTQFKNPAGPWIVLSTVFLMGTHAAFFAPAKYGIMPEILQPQVLSRGNGILESTTFLAAILGTVTGGLLSFVFKDQEYFIGLILTALALLGVVASLFIARVPAANPTRPFPINLFKPLVDNLRIMLRSRPLALSVLGIAFFIFMVAFMRATMYMHGESRIPRWDEFKTSLVVAAVALGAGLGSPLVGYLSGGKVELGLVPYGAVGMIIATLVAALVLDSTSALVVCLIFIGFFAGFYLVPMYTLLQHRAPKTSKGDLVATSNFINVVGAMFASALFFLLVLGAHAFGLAPAVAQKDIITGKLEVLEKDKHGRPWYAEVSGVTKGLRKIESTSWKEAMKEDGQKLLEHEEEFYIPDVDFEDRPQGEVETIHHEIEAIGLLQPGDEVTVSRYKIHEVVTYRLRVAGTPMPTAYNNESLPRYLFIGASLMTLGILILLCRQLPDFFVRALLWLRSQGRWRLKVVGINNLPTDGPVILATNCDRFESSMQVVAATDRFTRFVLLEIAEDKEPTPLLRYLARRTGLVALPAETVTGDDWDRALDKASRALGQGDLLGLTADGSVPSAEVEKLLHQLRERTPAPILPVYCGALRDPPARIRRVRVVIGRQMQPEATVEEIRRQIHLLGEWIHQTEEAGTTPKTTLIP
jgi:MFS family permease